MPDPGLTAVLLAASAAAQLRQGTRALSPAASACIGQDNCSACVVQLGCGWCSDYVRWENGMKGPRCVSPSVDSPFECPGTFRTVRCGADYSCDLSANQCVSTAPGQGWPKDQCSRDCAAPPPPSPGPPPVAYQCENSTATCHEVPAGTPGSTNLQGCKAYCGKPVPPPAPLPPVYICNNTTFQCTEAAPYTPGSTSLDLCEKGCGRWSCRPDILQCVRADPGSGTWLNKLDCLRICRAATDGCKERNTCEDCLKSSDCGWCSQVVTYVSGSQGSQCAGVGNGSVAFTCPGTYSTDTCLADYTCNSTSGKCEQTVPGKGMPRAQCAASCCVTPPSDCPTMDLMFCIDGSTSMGSREWTIVKQVTSFMATNFSWDAMCGIARMGIVQFGTKSMLPPSGTDCYGPDCTEPCYEGACDTRTQLEQNLTGDRHAFFTVIEGLKKIGGGTPTGDGLNAVHAEFLTSRARSGSVKVAVLITDGNPNFSGGQLNAVRNAEALRQVAPHLFVIGVGAARTRHAEIDLIASAPAAFNYTIYDNYWLELSSRVHSILKDREACSSGA
eukprot:TRINITY_DN56884_c0_g1_i1.p1 TRINITY_DN56884_c0_g1~~TRINITY_DN56884_c0_g1_i1.p1  ORF type:complete len:557 (+),score=51.02 TRINITY_DN56884_c0_g1_i1:74-1744(+)